MTQKGVGKLETDDDEDEETEIDDDDDTATPPVLDEELTGGHVNKVVMSEMLYNCAIHTLGVTDNHTDV